MTTMGPTPSGRLSEAHEAFAREIAEAIEDQMQSRNAWDAFRRWIDSPEPDEDDDDDYEGPLVAGPVANWGPRVDSTDARSVLLEWGRWAVLRLEASGQLAKA